MVGGKTALLSGVGSTAGRLNRFGVGSTGAVFVVPKLLEQI